jgi:hypothetical protein
MTRGKIVYMLEYSDYDEHDNYGCFSSRRSAEKFEAVIAKEKMDDMVKHQDSTLFNTPHKRKKELESAMCRFSIVPYKLNDPHWERRRRYAR